MDSPEAAPPPAPLYRTMVAVMVIIGILTGLSTEGSGEKKTRLAFTAMASFFGVVVAFLGFARIRKYILQNFEPAVLQMYNRIVAGLLALVGFGMFVGYASPGNTGNQVKNAFIAVASVIGAAVLYLNRGLITDFVNVQTVGVFVVSALVGLVVGVFAPGSVEYRAVYASLAVIGLLLVYGIRKYFPSVALLPDLSQYDPRVEKQFWISVGLLAVAVVGIAVGALKANPKAGSSVDLSIGWMAVIGVVLMLTYVAKRNWFSRMGIIMFLLFIVLLCVQYSGNAGVNRLSLFLTMFVPAAIMIAAIVNMGKLSYLEALPTNLLGLFCVLFYTLLVVLFFVMTGGEQKSLLKTNAALVFVLFLLSLIIIFVNKTVLLDSWSAFFGRLTFMCAALILVTYSFHFSITRLLSAPDETTSTDRAILGLIIAGFVVTFVATVLPWLPKPPQSSSIAGQYFLAWLYCRALDVFGGIRGGGGLTWLLLLEIALIVYYAYAKKLYRRLEEGAHGTQLFNEPLKLDSVYRYDVRGDEVAEDKDERDNNEFYGEADSENAGAPTEVTEEGKAALRAALTKRRGKKRQPKMNADQAAYVVQTLSLGELLVLQASTEFIIDRFEPPREDVAGAPVESQKVPRAFLAYMKEVVGSRRLKLEANYAFSFWLFLTPLPKDRDPASNKYVGILDLEGRPRITYNSGLNTLRVTVRRDNKTSAEFVADIPQVPLQRWHHVVVSCNFGTVDVFLNGVLYKSSLTRESGTSTAVRSLLEVGDVEGNPNNRICNMVYFLQKIDRRDQFRKKRDVIEPGKVMQIYNQFVNKNPPIISRVFSIQPTPSYANIRV